MEKEYGYIAGALFNEGEIAQRISEGKRLREKMPNVEWYNPIEAPVNDKSKLPTAEDIYSLDTEYVLKSDYVLADLSREDLGVCMELGICLGTTHARKVVEDILERKLLGKVEEKDIQEILREVEKEGIKNRKIVTHNSDIRIEAAEKYQSINIPYGYNQYVIGGLQKNGIEIAKNSEEAINKLKGE